MDGYRQVAACGAAHLAELQQYYRRRPFVSEEQWAAKIARAMSRHPEGLTLDELAATTGLNTIQLQAAALWSARGSDDEAGLPADA